MRLIAVLLFIYSILSSSCSNDLDIHAPWKETMAVFGLLNQQDSVHYIRLNKAFLGEGNALQFALAPDSTNYPPGQIELSLDEILNGVIQRSFTLQPVTNIPKDSGTFAYPGQVIYSFYTGNSEKLNTQASYQLRVSNKKSGLKLSAETKVLGNLNFDMPISTLNFYPKHSLNVKWKSVEGGALYEVFLRFLYREYNKETHSDTVRKYVEFSLGRLNMDYKGAFQSMSITLNNIDIYRTLGIQLERPSPQNPVARIADSLLVRINVADEDLATYIMINQPSNTLAQERPSYSNIDNGIGVFASRGSYTRKFRIGDFTVDSLRSNSFTKDLNFDQRP